MAIDLVNGWVKYDSASASNLYYGYNLNVSAATSDYTWLIRRVNTTSNVQTSAFANDNPVAFWSKWDNRASYFSSPTGNMALTYSLSTATSSGEIRYSTSSISWTNVTDRRITMTWSLLAGVDEYTITSKKQNGQLLDKNGIPIQGYNTRTYTDFVVNLTSYSLVFIESGTYTVTLAGQNNAGTTSSTVTINFSV